MTHRAPLDPFGAARANSRNVDKFLATSTPHRRYARPMRDESAASAIEPDGGLACKVPLRVAHALLAECRRVAPPLEQALWLPNAPLGTQRGFALPVRSAT